MPLRHSPRLENQPVVTTDQPQGWVERMDDILYGGSAVGTVLRWR